MWKGSEVERGRPSENVLSLEFIAVNGQEAQMQRLGWLKSRVSMCFRNHWARPEGKAVKGSTLGHLEGGRTAATQTLPASSPEPELADGT